MLTSASQMVATFKQIGTKLSSLRLASNRGIGQDAKPGLTAGLLLCDALRRSAGPANTTTTKKPGLCGRALKTSTLRFYDATLHYEFHFAGVAFAM